MVKRIIIERIATLRNEGQQENLQKFQDRRAVYGTVYTDAVSFVTASVSMRLRLSFTRRRSRSLSEPGRFEYALERVGRFQNDTVSLVV